jgi:adenine-specific DNA-methyltransferase
MPSKYEAIPKYSSDNTLVLADTRVALPGLISSFGSKIRCIYMDPPYNNGDLYSHYNDSLSHEDWIDELEEVLVGFKKLLSVDGSLWISIDDGNMHYLKVLADKVFGYTNFLTTIVWNHRNTRENRNIFSCNHEYILVYCIDKKEFKKWRKKLPNPVDVSLRYKNPDNDPRGPWQSVSAHVQDGHAVASQFYRIVAPSGKNHTLPRGRCWAYSEDRMSKEIQANNIWFGKNGLGVPRIKSFPKLDSHLVTPDTLWLAKDVGTTDRAKKHLLSIMADRAVFDTPKPETLIKRILDIATAENDIVLDGFLGSGTTASTAHKMNRRYICIERNESAFSYSVARMNAVLAGENGGVSKDVAWKGGGSFSYGRAPNI